MGGFYSGMHFKGIDYNSFVPHSEINFAPIAWIYQSLEVKPMGLATVDYPPSKLEKDLIQLDDFILPETQKIASTKVPNKSNIDELEILLSEVSTKESLDDYKIASINMHQSLVTALNATSMKPEAVTISASSAEILNKDQLLLDVSEKAVEPVVTNRINLNTHELSIQEKGPIPQVVSDLAVQNQIGSTLESALLNQHIDNQNILKESIQNQASLNNQKTEISDDEVETQETVSLTANQALNGCKEIEKVKLSKPVDAINGENSQICPMRKTWISKNQSGSGWVKLETEGHFQTLIHYPQANSENVLLLDQNSVALLAIKSGVHFSKNLGMILGTVPQGHKIEFSGRADDVQYLELNSKKYFFLLNVEPGAGVIEVISEKNPSELASVFVPVLEETISYLDIGSPVSKEIDIKVKKESESNKDDLANLTVSLSTQTQLQTLTDASGKAELKEVKVIEGYPIFLDIGSKLNGERSYQYRYELVSKAKDGSYLVKQFSEKKIYNWLKQIQTKINSQSGMIIGSLDRKKIDGFKNHYYVKTSDINEKESLKPKTLTVLWDEKLSDKEPLEGDNPRFLTVQAPEGLTQVNIVNDSNKMLQSSLIPVSPRVINVISE